MANVDGSHARRVIDDGLYPTLSPDGSSVAFIRFVDMTPFDLGLSGDVWRAADVWVARKDGSRLRRITNLYPTYARMEHGILKGSVFCYPVWSAVIFVCVFGVGLYTAIRMAVSKRSMGRPEGHRS